MKKYTLLTIIALPLLISCSSMPDKNEIINITFVEDDYLPLENDWTSLIIEKDYFSHKYVYDYGDDSISEVFVKNVMQAGLSIFPSGEYEFEGSVIYENYLWDINFNYKNYFFDYEINNLITCCCDDIVMENTNKRNCKNVFKNSDSDEIYFYTGDGNSRKSYCIIRPDGSIAATLNDRNNSFYFDKSITEEEKCDVLKCIALYKTYIKYVWSVRM